jgi:hypothetical protein
MGQRICNNHWNCDGNFKWYLFPCRHLMHLDHSLWRNSRLLSAITCLIKARLFFQFAVEEIPQRSLNWTHKMLHCNFGISFIQLAKKMDAASDRIVYLYLCCLNIWLSTMKSYELHACYNAIRYRFIKFKHFISFLNKKSRYFYMYPALLRECFLAR